MFPSPPPTTTRQGISRAPRTTYTITPVPARQGTVPGLLGVLLPLCPHMGRTGAAETRTDGLDWARPLGGDFRPLVHGPPISHSPIIVKTLFTHIGTENL